MARARRTSGDSSSRKRWRTRSRFRSSTSRGSTCSTRPARNGSRATSATGCSTWTGRSATGSRGPSDRGRDRRARTGARSRPSRGGSGQARGAVVATNDWTSCGDVASSRSWGETSSGGCGSRHDNRSTSRAFGTGSDGRRTCTTRFSDRTTRSAKAPGSRTSSTRRTNGPTSGTGRTRPTKDYNQLKTFYIPPFTTVRVTRYGVSFDNDRSGVHSRCSTRASGSYCTVGTSSPTRRPTRRGSLSGQHLSTNVCGQ